MLWIVGRPPGRPRAAELFAVGVRQAEVARQLGVSGQAVSVWHRRWQACGTDGLRSKGRSGPTPRLSDQQLAEIEQALLTGATDMRSAGADWADQELVEAVSNAGGMPSYPRLGPDELAVRARPAPALLGEERCAGAGTVAGRRRLLDDASLRRL